MSTLEDSTLIYGLLFWEWKITQMSSRAGYGDSLKCAVPCQGTAWRLSSSDAQGGTWVERMGVVWYFLWPGGPFSPVLLPYPSVMATCVCVQGYNYMCVWKFLGKQQDPNARSCHCCLLTFSFIWSLLHIWLLMTRSKKIVEPIAYRASESSLDVYTSRSDVLIPCGSPH